MGFLQRIVTAIADGWREVRTQPGRFAGLCALAVLILLSYGLLRPPLKSVFIDVYGSVNLRWAYLAIAAAAIVAASLWARLAATISLARLFPGVIALCAVAFLGLRVALAAHVPHIEFVLYVLMDTYIVVLVEAFWSLASLSYDFKSARVVYGFFLAAGSMGAGTAELGQGMLARSLGTENILWMVPPVLLLASLLCWLVARHATGVVAPKKKLARFREGLAVVLDSRYLLIVLFIVAASQILINLVDLQMSAMVEHYYPGVALRDQRTALFGQLHLIINMASLGLQLFNGVVVGALGVSAVLLAVPALAGATSTAMLLVPSLAANAAAFVSVKTFDYSIFKAAKEMLYLPLSVRAKTVGKAFVDMGTYRVAKAGASGLLFLLPLGTRAVAAAAVVMAVIWVGLTVVLVPRYRDAREHPGAAD